MNRSIAICVSFVLAAGTTGGVVTFEDLTVGTHSPLVSDGFLFTADRAENGIFPNNGPIFFPGATNGTHTYAWCGSECGDGVAQRITASHVSGEAFNLISLDAGNLLQRSTPLGYRDGMTIELIGHFEAGGTVTQSLVIVEDVFTTFDITGFVGITEVVLFAPATADGNPDPVIDNLVFTIPSGGSLAVLALSAICVTRRRRK